MLKSSDRNDLDPYIRQYDVAIDLSSKLHRSKLISILVKIRDVVYVQIINISLASRLICRSRSLTAVTSHRQHERYVVLSLVLLYYICTSMVQTLTGCLRILRKSCFGTDCSACWVECW